MSTEQTGPTRADLFYYRQRTKNRMHDLVLGRIAELADQGRPITRREIGEAIGRHPEQISRWLASPGNWTLETVSDLLLALGMELDADAAPIECELRQDSASETCHVHLGSTGPAGWEVETPSA